MAIIARRLPNLTDNDLGLLWRWLKNIVTKGFSDEKQREIEDIFNKERKMEKMVYTIERIMEQERIDVRTERDIEIARKLLEAGDSIEKVQMITDLPLTTIRELAQSMQSNQ